jgi:hypothetical protein
MRYIDAKGRPQVLTREQSYYLREGSQRRLEYGWGGYKSTLSVRLLEERGLITVAWSTTWPRWTITGLKALGEKVLSLWQAREAMRNSPVPAEHTEPSTEPEPAPARMRIVRQSVEPFVLLPAALMAATLESLERVGCQFDHCPGPDVPPVDMMTCHVCDVLRKLRAEA